ncbi:hypothetical protein ACX93W_17680 [Paenibacillus sp. CAU 1782]
MKKVIITTSMIEQFLISISFDEHLANEVAEHVMMENSKSIKWDHLSNNLSFNTQQYSYAWALAKSMMINKDEPEKISRWLTIMLIVGGERFLECSVGFTDDALWRRGCLNIMVKYKVPLTVVWNWFLQHDELHRFNRIPEQHTVSFLDEVAERQPDLMFDRIDEFPVAGQLFCALSLNKFGHERDKSLLWFEEQLKAYVEQQIRSDLKTSPRAEDIIVAIQTARDADFIQQLMHDANWEDIHVMNKWLCKSIFLAAETVNTVAFSDSFIQFLLKWSMERFNRLYSYATAHFDDEKQQLFPEILNKYGYGRDQYILLLADFSYKKKFLVKELKDNELYYLRAVENSRHLTTKTLCFVLWEIKDGFPYLKHMEEQLLDLVRIELERLNVASDDLIEMMSFLRGEPLTEAGKQILRKYRTDYSVYRFLLTVGEDLMPYTDLFYRILCFLAYADQQTFHLLCERSTRKDMATSTVLLGRVFNLGCEAADLLPDLVRTAIPKRYGSPEDKEWSKSVDYYLRKHVDGLAVELLQVLLSSELDKYEIGYLLDLLILQRPSESYIAVSFLDHDSKSVRDKAVTLLEPYPENEARIIDFATHKKIAVREGAIRLLCKWKTASGMVKLQEIWHKEKSDKMKALIANAIPL